MARDINRLRPLLVVQRVLFPCNDFILGSLFVSHRQSSRLAYDRQVAICSILINLGRPCVGTVCGVHCPFDCACFRPGKLRPTMALRDRASTRLPHHLLLSLDS